MKSRVLVCSLAVLLSTASASYAYDFHLLNGMVIKGELKEFKDDLFTVTTDFGTVIIQAGKLDYIIINQEDGHATSEGSPGVAVEGTATGRQAGPEPVAPETAGAAPAPPQPLKGGSAPPGPLEGWSLGLSGGLDYAPGIFTGVRMR